MATDLQHWATRPACFVPAYYELPAEKGGGPWRRAFSPQLDGARVTTWHGELLGTITRARVYTHNFGGRQISIRVQGTNGARYHGRASFDHGNVIRLWRAMQ